MRILAWYSLVIASVSVMASIAKDENEAQWRVLGVLLYVPVLIFIIRYLFM